MADCVSLWGRPALGKPATVLWGREGKGKELADVEKLQAEELRSQLKASTNHHTCEWMRLWSQSLGCDPRHRRVETNSPSCVLPDQKANCCFMLPSLGGICYMVTVTGTLNTLKETPMKVALKTMLEGTILSTPFLCFLLSSTFNHKCCS